MKEQLSDQDKILLKIVELCLAPVPKDFIGTAINHRIWEAFELGKLWQKRHLSSRINPDRRQAGPEYG